MSKQLKSDQQEPRYADVVHHANVKASVSYVQRKTGLSFNETSRLLELALQRGDLKYGDYAGRRLENYADDHTKALQARIAELEAWQEDVRSNSPLLARLERAEQRVQELEAQQERKPLTEGEIAEALLTHCGHIPPGYFVKNARAIERAHGIRE